MTVFEPAHMAAVLSSGRYISRMQLWFLLNQRNRLSFLRKLNKNENRTKKKICCTVRTLRKKIQQYFVTRDKLPAVNHLTGGIKLILVQFSSETDWSTAHLVQTSDLESVSMHSEKQVKKNILCEQEFRYRSLQE